MIDSRAQERADERVPPAATSAANLRSALSLGVVVIAMFGFGFLLVPLYSVFCEITGLNGKTGIVQAEELDGVADETRPITVEFLGDVNSGLPWKVRPVVRRMTVYPGVVYETAFVARNLARDRVVGQAVPSVSPGAASLYFNKTECFCFSRQQFDGGEQREMPVRFVIGKALPEGIDTVTLSYT
ncbi:MAG: cytochrome c oxidase assembly protein, partial [Gammaproteobacteria bacterium]